MNYRETLFRISSKVIELDNQMNPAIKKAYLIQLQTQMDKIPESHAELIYNGIKDIIEENSPVIETKLSGDNLFA